MPLMSSVFRLLPELALVRSVECIPHLSTGLSRESFHPHCATWEGERIMDSPCCDVALFGLKANQVDNFGEAISCRIA